MTRRPWMGDAALAGAIAVVQVGGTYLAGRHQPGREPFDLLAGVLLAVGPAALVVRRRFPVPVYVAAFAGTLAYTALGYPRGPIFFALIAAFLTAVLTGHRAVAWGLLGAGYVSFLLADTVFLDRPGPGWVPAVGLAAWLIVLAGTGEGIRARRDRGLEAARTREEEARRRASEERLRIARELHDVLAHNISLINVQAGVALTDREREVMALVGAGLTNEEIAERLYMSPATSKTHVSRAMVKLGARDRAQLVVFAYESGLVRPGWNG